MSAPKEPGDGCLSVLSSCFKGRGKRQSVDAQSPRPRGNAVVEISALPLSSTIAHERASTPRSTGDLVPGPIETKTPPSAVIDNKPRSAVSGSGQTSMLRKDCGAQLDLWQQAYNTAEENTRKWIHENIGDWSESANPFTELMDLVRSSDEKHDQDALQFKLHGRVVLLRDYTSRVTSCLTAIGDIAINFAPSPSPIIWNAVKVVLKVSLNVSRYSYSWKLMHSLGERISDCRRRVHHGMHKSASVLCQAGHSVSRSLSQQYYS